MRRIERAMRACHSPCQSGLERISSFAQGALCVAEGRDAYDVVSLHGWCA